MNLKVNNVAWRSCNKSKQTYKRPFEASVDFPQSMATNVIPGEPHSLADRSLKGNMPPAFKGALGVHAGFATKGLQESTCWSLSRNAWKRCSRPLR